MSVDGWRLPGWAWPETPEVVIDHWVQAARQSWLQRPDGKAPLSRAHCLLSDEAVADAIFRGLRRINWVMRISERPVIDPLTLRPVDPPWRLAPWREVILPQDEIMPDLREAVIRELGAGRLAAHGVAPDNPLRGRPFKIPAERLPRLTLDFRESTASLNGRQVAVGITVKAPSPPVNKNSPISGAVLTDWFEHYKAGKSVPPPGGHRAFLGAVIDEFGDRVSRKRVRGLYNSTWKRPDGAENNVPRNVPENYVGTIAHLGFRTIIVYLACIGSHKIRC